MNKRRIAAGLLGACAFGLALFAALSAIMSSDGQSYKEVNFFIDIATISIVAGLLSLALDWRIGIGVLLLIVVPAGYPFYNFLEQSRLLFLFR